MHIYMRNNSNVFNTYILYITNYYRKSILHLDVGFVIFDVVYSRYL